MIKSLSKFNQFRLIYNKSVKQVLGLPANVSISKIDKILGVQSAHNIVQASYIRNQRLWSKEFEQYDSNAMHNEEIKEHILEARDQIHKDVRYPDII